MVTFYSKIHVEFDNLYLIVLLLNQEFKNTYGTINQKHSFILSLQVIGRLCVQLAKL